MKIEVGEFNGFTEIKLNGRLDTNTSQDLESIMTDILSKGDENILVNFEELIYISSSGLRVFLVSAKKLGVKGKKLNFCNMSDYIKEVFDIAGFNIIFNFFHSRQEIVL